MSTPEKKRTHEQSGGGGGGAIARKSSKKPRAALFRKCSVKDCGRDIGSDDEDEELSFCCRRKNVCAHCWDDDAALRRSGIALCGACMEKPVCKRCATACSECNKSTCGGADPDCITTECSCGRATFCADCLPEQHRCETCRHYGCEACIRDDENDVQVCAECSIVICDQCVDGCEKRPIAGPFGDGTCGNETETVVFCTECSCGAMASYRARERSGEVRCRGTNQQGARCGLTSSMVDINEEAAPLARGERCCGYHSGQGGTKWRMVHGNWEQFE
jgi:hypothetical protein